MISENGMDFLKKYCHGGYSEVPFFLLLKINWLGVTIKKNLFVPISTSISPSCPHGAVSGEPPRQLRPFFSDGFWSPDAHPWQKFPPLVVHNSLYIIHWSHSQQYLWIKWSLLDVSGKFPHHSLRHFLRRCPQTLTLCIPFHSRLCQYGHPSHICFFFSFLKCGCPFLHHTRGSHSTSVG